MTRNHSELDELKQQTAGPLHPPKRKSGNKVDQYLRTQRTVSSACACHHDLERKKISYIHTIFIYLTANAAYNIPQTKTIFFFIDINY